MAEHLADPHAAALDGATSDPSAGVPSGGELAAPLEAGIKAAPLADEARTALDPHLLALVNSAPSLIFLKDVRFRYLFANERFGSYGPKTCDEMVGLTDHDLLPEESAERLRADEVQVMSSRKMLEYEEQVTTPRGTRDFYTVKFPVYDARGELLGVGGFVTDITERKRIEAERLALHQQVIAAQQTTLRELSTPLLPIAEGVLAMPLVGTIDNARAREILETLLQGITAQRARTAILDVTGIRLMDAEVANALVNAARAARLLGARVVLTGISPAVAQTLVALGADLGDVTTLATLASGIAFALKS
jgi:anti-anti-sigma factor